jgi:hypothetical protein
VVLEVRRARSSVVAGECNLLSTLKENVSNTAAVARSKHDLFPFVSELCSRIHSIYYQCSFALVKPSSTLFVIPMSEIIITVRLDGVRAVCYHRDLLHLGFSHDFPVAILAVGDPRPEV